MPVIAQSAVARNMPVSLTFAWWPTVAVVLIAAVIDIRTHKIPNWLVLPFLAAGVTASGLVRGWNGVEDSLLGIAGAAITLGVFCYLGGMGMGDLKLCAALGAWLGPSRLFGVLLFTGMAGGAMAVCWALAGGFFTTTIRGVIELLRGFGRNGLRPHETVVLSNPAARRMPYAPAIAVGTLLSFLGTP